MPFNLPLRGNSASGPRRVYRQPAMLAPGIVLSLVCIAFLVVALVDSGLSKAGPILWPIAGLLLIWVVFLRPCVALTQAGFVMRNLVRDVSGGWPAIDLVEQRWNLKIFGANGKGHGSWAITSQRPRRINRRTGIHGGPGLGDIDSDNPTASVMAPRPGSAAGVAAAIRAGQADYADAVKRDPSVRARDELAVEPAWPAIGAVVLAIICIVTAVVA